MSKKVAILQSNYIPWKGYFDLISRVDEFIIYDDMQYTKRDWRNRNQIKTAAGLLWLSIPVKTKGSYFQAINETRVVGHDWAEKHWKTIKQNYSRSACFKENEGWLQELYEQSSAIDYLSEINVLFIKSICSYFNIETTITMSSDYAGVGSKTERLISLCKQANATSYLSGPSAKSYIELALFQNENIELEWMDYSGYEDYVQLYSPFLHNVSIVDLIFNLGKGASKYFIKDLQR